MTKLELTKNVAATVVGLSTSRIVGQVIKNNANMETAVDQAAAAAAAFALGGIAADRAKEYTDKTIDSVVNWYHENIKKTS